MTAHARARGTGRRLSRGTEGGRKSALPAVTFVFLLVAGLNAIAAEPLTVTLTTPPAAESGYFQMGTAGNPEGRELGVDSRSLRLDGQPWVPVMGEFHYSRYPAEEWREELLKMKAGGIDIVATYVFWIHHEEVQGEWDWSGRRDLRRFVEAARDAGLFLIVRCGPWCHGEVRNGGFPEWAARRTDWKPRSTDPKFLDAVRPLYAQIVAQLRGLLWKDGGPVIGIQVDNEYRGPGEYLATLKRIARDAGLDVPLYTRTGWPELSSPVPRGEILPLYGVYAEGFWDREVTPMPGRYWAGFHFSTLRSDANIANELLGRRDARDSDDVAMYPYLTCEIGGGMMSSYHRRILVDPRDIEATTLVKLGSGSTGPGYYMYHGGTNPDGRLTTLMEAQDTVMTNYNDLPVKNYDFQAPLGEFGQVRPQYHTLRRLHLFLDDYGGDLAGMTTALPDRRPEGKDDVTTLRWAVRSDGRSGFVFVNNYERLKTLPEKRGVQFALKRADGSTRIFPTRPVTVPGNAIFWWPVDVTVHGVTFSATAQPFSHIVEADGTRTLFFAATPGVPAEFVFENEGLARVEASGRIVREGGRTMVDDVKPGRAPAVRLETAAGRAMQIVLLDEADSLAFWKGPVAGRRRVVLTRGDVVFDNDRLRVTASEPVAVAIFPPIAALATEEAPVALERDGLFLTGILPVPTMAPLEVETEPLREAGPAREIKLGPIRQPVAQAPGDGDFAGAAVWRVKLSRGFDAARDPRLRIDYVGDVARLTIGGRLVADDFYNGNAFEFGLRRFEAALRGGELELAVLPLREDAPVYLAESARPDFGGAKSVGTLRRVELRQATTVTLTARPADEPKLPRHFRTELAIPPSKF